MVQAAVVSGEHRRPEWLRNRPRAWVAAVATVCFGAFMGQLDASVVALAYHSIGSEFGASLGAVQWVGLAYLAVLAALLLPLGRLSDRIGRKRVYLWGFAAFTITSAACAAAPNLTTLVLARAGQGAGAAMLQANSVAIVATAAPKARLRTALGLQAAGQALGLALGPSLGGIVVDAVGWRWVFAINVPVGIAGLLAGRYLIPRTRLAPSQPTVRRIVRPLLPGLAGALLAYLLLFGPIVLVPAVQQGAGHGALAAGLAVAALPAGFAAGATFGGWLLPGAWTDRGRGRLGLLLAGAGLAGLATTLPSLLPGAIALAVAGLGLGIYTPANNAQVMASAPPGVAALAGGLVSASRAAGTAAGTLAVTTLLVPDGSGRLAAAALTATALAAATVLSARVSPSRRSDRARRA